ncbi:MAG: aminotransferase class III-fold pyridoxal phosphate-dependent enzyme [Clostridia bacterium]|nr:aminotransferase class III-fold pyridoxal phosphate-dependent enzyme [Clostridia bacterium]
MIGHAGLCSINTTDSQELRFRRGKGCYVYDDTGSCFIDFILGFGPVVIGHADDEFNKMLKEYLECGFHFPGYSTFHEIFSSLIEENGWPVVSYFKTSSESITAAIRVAMAATKKKGIVRCGFIGWHDAEIANTISWHEYPESSLRGEIRFTENFRGVTGDEEVVNWYSFDLDELKDILKKGRTAVFIIDAFQIHFTSVNIIQEALKICKEYNVLTVLDETKTSGRVKLFGVSEYYNLESDLLVMGKAIANGAPLSLLCGKKELSDYAKKARITGTFSKETFSVYCALATQKIIKENNGYDALGQIGKGIVGLINDVISETSLEYLVEAVNVFNGSMIDLKFKKYVINDKSARSQLRTYMADNGILLLQGHPSFICIDHKYLDLNYFKKCLRASFLEWEKYLWLFNNNKMKTPV